GLAVGFWKDEQELSAQRKVQRRFEPKMSAARRDELYAGWQRAVERSKGWAV
ncbi:MAG TPA: glycerol kinase, partial [Terriglobia bacterium]|nr:glycerol kinase [Terriglobia bacterium]